MRFLLAAVCALRALPALAAPRPIRPVPELIAALKSSETPDPEVVAELAHAGPAAIPALVELAGEVVDVNTGVLQGVSVKPYIDRVRVVIEAIDDPADVPALKRVVADPDLGPAARQKLLDLNAPWTLKEIAALVADDKKNFSVEARMDDQYPRLLALLAPGDAAKLLMDFLRPNSDLLVFNLNDGDGVHNAKPEDLRFVRAALALLAKTRSPDAKKLLERQFRGLTKAAAERRAELASPNRMSFYDEEGRRNVKKDADMIAALLPDYKKALDELTLPAAKP